VRDPNQDMDGEQQPLLSKNELDTVARNISTFVSCLSQFSSGLKKLGTPSDTSMLREALRSKIEEIIALIRQTNELFKRLGVLQSTGADFKTKYQKLLLTFQDLNQQFQSLSEEYKKKERSFRPLQTNDDLENTSHRASQVEDIGRMNITEVESTDHDRLILEERNAGIRQVTEDLTTLHEIFVDVAKMVGDQGQELNQVEENVHQSNISVIQATEDLRDASELQRSGSKKKICICFVVLIGLIIIVVVIGVVVWFAVK